MGPEQWDQVRELFHHALDLPPDQRPRFLAESCGTPEIRVEVESLLASFSTRWDFLETPALEQAGQALQAAISGIPDVERQEQVKAILDQAVDKDPSERESFLEEACGNDAKLIAEVRWALAATGDLLDKRLERLRNAGSPLPPGTVLKGRYRIQRKLGQGGFGRVFLANDEQLHSRPVVIKTMLDENSSDPWFEKRFSEEIRALSTIDHPGVVGVLDTGRTDDGALFLVMQYVEGKSLRALIQPHGMALTRVAALVRQIAQALSAAHDKGIVHRDLKPENIIIQSVAGEEHARLIDFGIAQLRAASPDYTSITESRRVVGSPAYMAPEQLTGRAGQESDIYALGVVAYEMLTGKKPFQSQNLVDLYKMQAAGAFPKPGRLRGNLPEDAERLLMQALVFSPTQRPRSAREFGYRFAAALEARSSTPLPERTPAERPEVVHPVAASRACEYEVFLCHASRDQELALRLVGELEARGARCFLTQRDVPADQAVPPAVVRALSESSCLLALLTEDANASVQLSREVEAAAVQSMPVLVLRIDGVQPSGDLPFFLSRAQSIECSGELAASDLDRIERLIRSTIAPFSNTSLHRAPPQPVPNAPAEPLLTEFGSIPVFGRPGQRRVRLVAFFFCWALLTCVLSAFANAGYITVMLVGPTGQMLPVRFGYLYELNGAFAYLFAVPCFAYFGLGFVLEAQVALTKLVSRDQIVTDQPDMPEPAIARWIRNVKMRFQPGGIQPAAANATRSTTKGALQRIGEVNRRWMNKPVLAIVLLGVSLIIVGTEYLPPASDYKHVMFGYVQAPWIADYPRECPNCTLAGLERRLNRAIEPLAGMTADQLGAYRIIEPFYRRDNTVTERVAFVLFMISVLGLQVVFVAFIVWVVLKAFLFLQLIYRAAVPTKSIVVALHLRYTDPAGMFGLEPIHRALRLLVATIAVNTVFPVLSWWTNVLKGSRRALEEDIHVLGGWGQFLISNGGFVVSLGLLLYLVHIGGKAGEAASEESKRLASMPQRGRGSRNLEQLLDLIEEQSIWRKARYTISYFLAPLACLLPVLLLNRSNIAYQVGNAWEYCLKYVLGKA